MEQQLSSSSMKNPVNIIRSEADPFYRYKMPKLQVEYQGKNQATVTLVPNLKEIAVALRTEPEYIMKYFSVTLNLRVSANGIRGRYTAEQLASLLDEFIEKFALCTVCRHPRIQLVISKGNLSRSCAGCGAQEKKKQNKKGPKADENQDNDAEDFFIGAMQGNPLTSNMF